MRKSHIACFHPRRADRRCHCWHVGEKRAAPVRAVGEPVRCVSLSQIRSTTVVDNSTIDFKMAGGKIYRNSLPYSCPGLKDPRTAFRIALR